MTKANIQGHVLAKAIDNSEGRTILLAVSLGLVSVCLVSSKAYLNYYTLNPQTLF